ncbi:S-layer homology domain-containing protein [Candidatus Peregrinibacteria bacterium]|nr:S-layer homology domain-containing protein [Candidatus Peregrinibacteria bacterium]
MRSAFLSFAALVLFSPGFAADGAFSDVPADHPHAGAIEYVRSRGIVRGYADGTYKPDATINRAEFTKIIVGSVAAKHSIDACIMGMGLLTDYITDVPKNAWFAPYICYALESTFVIGYDDRTFRPEKSINVAEASKIIAYAYFKDVSSTDPVWYKPFIDLLAEHHAIPTDIRSFDQLLTRGQMAEMIARLHAHDDSKPSLTYEEIGAVSEVPPSKNSFTEVGRTVLATIPSTFVPYSAHANNMNLPHFTNVVFSPDGKKVAYVRVNPSRTSGMGVEWAFVEGNNAGNAHPGMGDPFKIRGYPVFSADGQNLAYAVTENNEYFVVLNGQEQKHYPYSATAGNPGAPRFTPDTNQIVYFAPPSHAPHGEKIATVSLVLGTKEISLPFPAPGSISYENNVVPLTGNRFAYVAQTQWCSAHDNCTFLRGYFSSFPPEMPAMEFVVVMDGTANLVRKTSPVSSVSWFRISPDGSSIVYASRLGEKESITMEDATRSPKSLFMQDGTVFEPLFSPTGRHTAFIVKIPATSGTMYPQYYLAWNAKQSGRYDAIERVTWNSDESRIAYSARKGTTVFVFLDDQEKQSYSPASGEYVFIDQFIFDPSGRHLAFIICRKAGEEMKSCSLSVDGTEGAHVDRIWKPVFSTDGSSISYGELNNNTLSWVTVKVH